MLPYYGLVLYIFIMALVFKGPEKRDKFIIAAFLGLFFIMGFRNATMIGDDSSTSYYQEFLDIRLGGEIISKYNIGLPLMMYPIFKITGNYQIFLMVESAVVCYAYCQLVRKYSSQSFLSIMWYMGMVIYLFLFSAMKQAMAMAILCYAFDALIEKKRGKFFVLTLIAGLFHYPAIVFLPAWWIAKIKSGRAFIGLLVGTFIATFFFRTQILNLMGSMYKGSADVESLDVTFFGTTVIIMLLIIAFAIMKRMPDLQNDRTYTILFYFMCIAVVFQTFCYYSNIFERLANYYYHFSILFMPLLFEKEKLNGSIFNQSITSTINHFGPVVITAFSVIRFLMYLSGGSGNLAPFYFFWEGTKVIVI